MDFPAEKSEGRAAPDHGPDAVAEPSASSRRRFLRMAGAGAAGALGTAAALGTAGGASAAHFRDVNAARHRNNGATVAQLSSATSLSVLWRADTDRKVLALTFDDGPGDEHTAPALDALAAAGARATFAVVGRNAARLPDLVRRAHAEGHEIANHTWTHADLGMKSYAANQRELERTDDLVTKLTGAPTAVIRPPFGRVTGSLLQYAAQTKQGIILWDMRLLEDELDTAGNAAHVLRNLRPGTVLLAHDAGLAKRRIGMAAIPEILRGSAEQGYEFVTASELFAIDAGRR